MDLQPIYELRNRLRTVMIAGTNVIQEDFRLKRAVEGIQGLKPLSPVFQKIGELAEKPLEQDCEDREGTLLTVITLVDALLCTQGQVSVSKEVEPLMAGTSGSVVTNVPYSQVKELIQSLTTSGNGHYQFVLDTHSEKPELFSDFRIKSAMVQALGAGYAELAETVLEWLKEEGKEILPLLKKDFDPKGKKEMLRRIKVIEAVAAGEENDFYIQNIPLAEGVVKNTLIYALRHHSANVKLLLELIKKEKGNAKKMAYYALASIEEEEAGQFFQKLYEKKNIDVMEYLTGSTTMWASQMVAQSLMKQLSICRKSEYKTLEQVFSVEDINLLTCTLEALPGKRGSEIVAAFREACDVEEIYYRSSNDDKIHKLILHPARRVRSEVGYGTKGYQEIISYYLETSIRIWKEEALCALAEELYEKKLSQGEKGRSELYFPAAFVAKLLTQEDCSEWLQKEIFITNSSSKRRNLLLEHYIAIGLDGLCYEKKTNSYVLQTFLTDEADDSVELYQQQVAVQNISGSFTDVLMEYSKWLVDKRIMAYFSKEDTTLCQKLETYFYRQALKASTDYQCVSYWYALKDCGCQRCQGLLVRCVKKASDLTLWTLYSKMMVLPGTLEEFEQEVMEVYQLVDKGEVRIRGWNPKTFLSHVEEIKQKRFG